MKKALISAILILTVIIFAFLSVFANETARSGMLFGHERPEDMDVIYLNDGSVLKGTVKLEVLNIVTTYGTVAIPIRKCAGLSFEGTFPFTETVVTVNLNKFTGIIDNQIIRFRIDSSGKTVELRKERIDCILLKRTAEELDFVVNSPNQYLFIMINGDLLTGKPNRSQLIVDAEGTEMKVDFNETKEVTMLREQSKIAFSRKNGETNTGEPITEEFTLDLEIGTRVENIYLWKITKVLIDEGNAQIASFFDEQVSTDGTTWDRTIPTMQPSQEISLKIPGTSIDLEMRLIPAGNFMMGSPVGEQDRYSDEGPQHQVMISTAFYMGMYEVTQAQWEAVMGTRPSYFGYNADYPVEKVSWDDCQKFIQKLNTMGIGTYRLPTEAEWEYACRAGSTTRFSFGDDASYSLIGQYAWYDSNSSSTTHTVGQKKPNAWGLYDMHGNVYEWCSDWYGSYIAGTQTDPKGAGSGTLRVIRGGSWLNYPQVCRSAYRFHFTPPSTYNYVGFRLVRLL